MSERTLVPEPCRRPGKDGGLAQVLQRRTPPWGNRPKAADYVAESRWRSQPAIVSKPENSSLRRSKDGSQCKSRKTLPSGDPKMGLSAPTIQLYRTSLPAVGSSTTSITGSGRHLGAGDQCRRHSMVPCWECVQQQGEFNIQIPTLRQPLQWQSYLLRAHGPATVPVHICPLPLIDATKCPAARKSTKRYRHSCASRRRSPARTRGRRRSCHPSRCDLQERASRPA